jgi:hypothetical protein
MNSIPARPEPLPPARWQDGIKEKETSSSQFRPQTPVIPPCLDPLAISFVKGKRKQKQKKKGCTKVITLEFVW